MKGGKFNRSKAKKALAKSEGATTATGSAGHARGRHAAPVLEEGPSVDAALLARCVKARAGTKITAFMNERDQDRAVSYALSDKDATVTDSVDVKGRKTVVSTVKTPLTDITVRAAKVDADGHAECFSAKLRAVTVVYDGDNKIVTAFPSTTYPD